MKNLIKKWNNISLIKRIICGLIIGLILGLVVPQASVISILGTMFVGALKGIAPLLVFFLVMSALCHMKTGQKTNLKFIIVLYMVGNLVSAFVAVIACRLFPVTLTFTDSASSTDITPPSGIAEVLTVVDEILKEGLPHGKICIGFTPDEEMARGAKHFDVEGFGADYGYTLDGSAEGEIQYENFNASTAFITIHGVSVHTGTAKDVLVNSQTIGTEFHQMLPVSERPETTEGYEGFYHLVSFHGNVTETKMKYFIRDFDTEGFHARAAKMQEIADSLNEKYGAGTVEIEIVESYYNMREKIEPCMQLIEYAKKAAENADIVPDVAPIRGGTDGARLSFKGLPCPNLGTGGYAFHGVYEHITVEGMDKAVVMVKDIVGMFAK